MKAENSASRFLSSLERETVKVLGAAALIKPILDRIGVPEIVNGYVSNGPEITQGDVIEILTINGLFETQPPTTYRGSARKNIVLLHTPEGIYFDSFIYMRLFYICI